MKVAIENRINANQIVTASVVVNNSTDAATTRQFITIAEGYAMGDDGEVYQVLNEMPTCDTLILVYELDGVFYNYAEDELDVEGTQDYLSEIKAQWQELCENDFADEPEGDSYDNDDISHSRNEFVNILEEKLGWVSSYGDFCYMCGMNKRFNDLGTKFNPYYSATEYVPHTIYYFF